MHIRNTFIFILKDYQNISYLTTKV